MKNKKIIYFFELIIFIFIILFKFIFLKQSSKTSDYINIFFWMMLSIAMLLVYRFPKDKNYYKDTIIRMIIIHLLSFLIIIYSIGLFTGYGRLVYSHTLTSIISNIMPIILLIAAQTIVRYLISKNTLNDKLPISILTFEYIILGIIIGIQYYQFYDAESIFKFICVICFPCIAKELLYSYITYKVSLVPSIIVQLAFALYQYILPIFPNLGDYLISILGVFFPYTIYKNISDTIKKGDKITEHIAKVRGRLLFLPVICLLIILIILNIGIFKYQMITIASNSMVPIYSRGDAIIFEKIDADNFDSIGEGYIIAFKQNGNIITHRVTKVVKTKDNYYFKTKGDNNLYNDTFIVNGNDVLGIVKYVVPKIGYPALWVGET